MIVDSSALLAILRAEAEADALTAAIGAAPVVRMAAPNLVECGIVAEGKRRAYGGGDLDLLIARLGIEVVAFTAGQADLARRAYRRFGKGLHPAGLNFGDTFAYALAKEAGEPLLFKGFDFAKTDITAARY